MGWGERKRTEEGVSWNKPRTTHPRHRHPVVMNINFLSGALINNRRKLKPRKSQARNTLKGEGDEEEEKEEKGGVEEAREGRWMEEERRRSESRKGQGKKKWKERPYRLLYFGNARFVRNFHYLSSDAKGLLMCRCSVPFDNRYATT